MRLVFLMDPLDRVLPDKDTTFAFIRAARKRGHETLHCLARDLIIEGPETHAIVRSVETLDREPHIELGAAAHQISLADVDAVFIRKDPPFDRGYLYATLLLEHARENGRGKKPLFINDPRGLRDANEKLYALNFPEFTPRTRVTSDRDLIHAFARDVGGQAVVKPLDGAGGLGVMMLRVGDMNARAIVDSVTHEGQRLALVQEYLPSVTTGDKRVLLLDGEVLGAILRVPRTDDLRSNIHVGGSVVPTELTKRELEMVAALAPKLRRDGLFFVGLDVIGERLTEVNVTSPTGIRELSRFVGAPVEERVIEWVEKKRAQGG